MEDDLIDDSGFELGLPSHVEMLQHYCSVLEAELDTTRQDLRRAHKTIAGLIVMYRDGSKELAALKIEHERLRRTLSDMYRREREQETSRMGYAYGDHTKGKT
ncbi:hypothetical protein [Pseudomonas sp. LB3P38]|uniref:hypothetical protein n=1 Tax=Pseudomonas lyxosi TaxID=3398358 RepID=UPI0039F015DE